LDLQFDPPDHTLQPMPRVTIEMTLPVYDGFMDECNPFSREYAVLKTGRIFRRQKDDHFERVIEINCDLEDANRLLSLAIKLYPDAVADKPEACEADTKDTRRGQKPLPK
jgi:hypothetical protein